MIHGACVLIYTRSERERETAKKKLIHRVRQIQRENQPIKMDTEKHGNIARQTKKKCSVSTRMMANELLF